jgi:hypothetical protein
MRQPPKNKLTFIDVSQSKNPYLQTITRAIAHYNLLLPTFINQKQKDRAYVLDGKMVGYLDAIVKSGFAYLLSRPPTSRSARGQERVGKIGELVEQVFDHADYFGIKFLHGDLSDDKQWNYWAERATGHYIDHDEMGKLAAAWLASSEAKPFSDGLTNADNTLEYFSAAQRSGFEVRFVGQDIVDSQGGMLDTTQGTGAFSGLNGSYIFVCSAATRRIYTAPSETGKLHHSSFLAGEPVLAAGDWVVDKGKLQLINGESGHYRPAGSNIALFVRAFSASLRPSAWVQPFRNGAVYKIGDYLRDGRKARQDHAGRMYVEERT